MTVDEILEQAKRLAPQEREELTRRLLDMQDVPEPPTRPKTGAEIVAILEDMDGPVELVDSHIEDPVEWVKTQRQRVLQGPPKG